MSRHYSGEIHLSRSRTRSRRGFRRQDFADLDDGDVVGNFLDGLDEEGRQISAVGTEPDLTASQIRYVDESGGSRSSSGGLEESGGECGAVADLVDFLGAEVVEEDVEGEDVLDGGDGVAFRGQGGHGGVVDGEDGYGCSPVDFAGEVSLGEEVVEGGERRVAC